MAIQRRTATVTIYQGDYLDRIRDLERRAEAAKEAESVAPRTLGELPEYLSLAEQHDALVAEAEKSAVHVRVQALRRTSWKTLVSNHPPREGNKGDQAVGVNEDTFREALVTFVNDADPEERTIVGGLDAADVDDLSDVDYERIYFSAFALNRGAGATPKASLVSRMSQESDETSN